MFSWSPSDVRFYIKIRPIDEGVGGKVFKCEVGAKAANVHTVGFNAFFITSAYVEANVSTKRVH